MEEAEFRQKLSPEQYRVMRQKGTEAPHTGAYWNHDEVGLYTCAACGSVLFLSLNKFSAEDGFPAFTKSANTHSIALAKDGDRSEVTCKKCGSHLGYMVGEKHLQINSTALDFLELPDLPDVEWENGEEKSDATRTSSSTQSVSMTIGGLTIGAVVGAGALWAATPTPMCPVDQVAVQPVAGQTGTAATPPPPPPPPAGSSKGGIPDSSASAVSAPSATLESTSPAGASEDGTGTSAGSADGTR